MTEPVVPPDQSDPMPPPPQGAAERSSGGVPAAKAAIRIESLPDLHEPVLLCAFAGWNDAAQSATGAVRYLIEQSLATRFAGIDPEEFYVFTETRPTVHLVDGGQRALDWPANDFYYLRNPRLKHDLVLLAGIEPQLAWRTFTDTVLDVATRVKASIVVTLGGLLADVAYSAPVRLTGAATHPNLLAHWSELEVRSSRYEGPTGIVGVLSDACRHRGIPSASLWASVPHYISVSPNPKTLAALVQRVDAMLGLNLDLVALVEASERFDLQVAEAVDENPEVRRYIAQLESHDGDDEEALPPELPSGAAIVEELEEFLRERHQEDEDDDDDD